MVAALKVGDKTPRLITKCASFALLDGARVTIMVYVFVVVPSWAVTTVVMVLDPTANGSAPDAVPDVTAVPLTVTIACDSLVVGVTIMEVMVLLTVVV